MKRSEFLILLIGNGALLLLFFISSRIWSLEYLPINSLGSSFLFALTTFYLLLKARLLPEDDKGAGLMSLSAGAALLRIAIGIVWIVAMNRYFEPKTNFFALEFIAIYLFYLIADVKLISDALRSKPS